MFRRLGLLVLVICALLVAGCMPAGGPQQSTSPDPVVMVPPTIDGSGRTDVSAAFAAFLASVPDGRTIRLAPGAQYRMESTFVVQNRHRLTFDGNGARVYATTPGDRNRSNILVRTSSDIVFQDLTVRGANPRGGKDGIFDLAREAQGGFTIEGTRSLTLRNVTVTDTYGDFVFIGVDPSGIWPDDIHVTNSTFARSGRQGITVMAGRNVVVENNRLDDMRRATIDLEPGPAPRFGVDTVTIRNNDIGPGELNTVAAAGRAPVNNVTFQGNRLHGQALQVFVQDATGGARRNWKIIGNTSDTPLTNPHQAAMRFWRVTGVQVQGNYQPFKLPRVMVGVWTQDSCGLALTGNNYPNSMAESRSFGGC
jgi:hypothetical protein